MPNKVDNHTIERIKHLLSQNLTQEVIGIRLGISPRTIRVYLRSIRTGNKPYERGTPSTTPESLNDA